MATSKILYMKDCGKAFHGKHLKASLQYIMAKEKTQDGRLISGINCLPENAFEQMRETKRKFGKIDKRQGYHLIISFVENEVDADTAFELTGKFVKEYLGQDYEAVYTVHDNTDHIHAHIVFNSVSFRTGKKYRYEKGDWAKEIQPITNRLCEEYGLSTIEIENDRAKAYESRQLWNEYRDGPFGWDEMIKRDLDICIVQSADYQEFMNRLQEKGYEIKCGKYFAVKPPGMPRFRRCKTLGSDYTEDRIKERILKETLSNYKAESFDEAEKNVYSKILKGKRAKLTKMQKKYYSRLYRIGLMKRKPYSQVWKYKEDIRRMNEMQEKYLYLIEHDVKTVEDLLKLQKEVANKKKEISSEKSKLYRKKNECKSLFEVSDKMKELQECENAYKSGDNFFEDEHLKWKNLEAVLKEQGYSYEEVVAMKEFYREKAMELRKQETAVKKEENLILNILNESIEEREFEMHQENEKEIEQEQPSH